MGIREVLVLDHFYVSFTEQDFSALLPLKDILKKTYHKKVEVEGSG